MKATNYVCWEPKEDNIGRIMFETDSKEIYKDIKRLLDWYFESQEHKERKADEPSVFEWLDIIKGKPLKEWPQIPDEFLCYSFKGHLAINVGGAIFGYDASAEKWNMEGII